VAELAQDARDSAEDGEIEPATNSHSGVPSEVRQNKMAQIQEQLDKE